MEYGRHKTDAQTSKDDALRTGSNVVELAGHRAALEARFPKVEEVADRITSDARLAAYTFSRVD